MSRIELPKKLVPVFTGEALFRGAYGGRGSAKTRSFAKMAAVRGLQCARAGESGVIVCGREFQNSLDESSMAEVKAAIESEPWLLENYELGEKFIRTWDGRIDFAFVGLRRNIESVKSTSRIRLFWVDEAEPVSETAWAKAIPTVREEHAEIWVTWNPERRASATNQRFRINPPADSKFAEMNWRDNPWFPTVLDAIRKEDEVKRPEQYGHIWEGDYATAHAGAYYAALLGQAQREGRIGRVTKDPLLAVRAYLDLGGTGAKSDAFAMWICQFIGREVRILDYYEAVGQPLGVHLDWLRERGWGKAQVFLPHDGSTHDRVYDVSFESAIQSAGFPVTVIPNQGKGAARARIEAARRIFPMCWFNEEATNDGRDALGWYHERKSEDVRDVGLGPEHDWSSHCFSSETEVLTRFGTHRMIDLPFEGEVLTRWGWKAYRNPRMTLRNASLVAVTFNDGLTVKCTPDHLFATELGWRSAQFLEPGITIQSSLTSVLSNGVADFIGFGQKKGIWRKAGRATGGCTGTFGRQLLGRFLRDATFTTVTAIHSIIRLPIWSVCQPASISAIHGTNVRYSLGSTLVTRRFEGQLSGMRVRRALPGTASTQRRQKVGLNGSASLESVSGAGRSLPPLSVRALLCRFIANLNAKLRRIGPKSGSTNGLLTIAYVRRLSETADVWDLTVPGVEEFSLANGAVVHNSADAFGLMCVAYETPAGRPKKLIYPAMGIV